MLFTLPVSGQETQGHFCESNLAILDGLAQEVIHSHERLYVIAHYGKQENRHWNKRRLHNVREYHRLTFGAKLNPEQMVFAESDKIAGGQVKFYLGSKLLMTVNFKRKGDFCVHCCEGPFPNYYGRGKADNRRKQR
jgi:hypothetical protein